MKTPPTILVFTLGKGRLKQGTPQPGRSRYETVQYSFSQGVDSEPTAFFGLALLRWLQSCGKNVSSVVVLGTNASLWDALLDALKDLQEADFGLADSLKSLVDSGSVAASDLVGLGTRLSEELGVTVVCRVVSEARTERDQLEVLQSLASEIPKNAQLHMCVTHGLRHMPMLQMLSLFQLRMTHSIELAGLYYGALELKGTNPTCPVIELTGAAQIQDWNMGLATVQNTGRLNVLAELCRQEAQDLATSLDKADVLLQMNHTRKAAVHAQAARQWINEKGLPGAGRLFSTATAELLSWSLDTQLWNQQRMLADQALKNGDLMRTAVLCFEAFLSKWVQDKAELENYAARQEAETALFDFLQGDDKFKLAVLTKIRNSTAHGTEATGSEASKEANRLMASPQNLASFLRDRLRQVTQLPARKN